MASAFSYTSFLSLDRANDRKYRRGKRTSSVILSAIFRHAFAGLELSGALTEPCAAKLDKTRLSLTKGKQRIPKSAAAASNATEIIFL